MRVRPLKPVLTCHHAGSISPGFPLPSPSQWDFNFIFPCNTTLTAKELEMHYQAAPKLGLLPLINKIIIRVVIPLNRSFCKYLNPINKVLSWWGGGGLEGSCSKHRRWERWQAAASFLCSSAPRVAGRILINAALSGKRLLGGSWHWLFQNQKITGRSSFTVHRENSLIKTNNFLTFHCGMRLIA